MKKIITTTLLIIMAIHLQAYTLIPVNEKLRASMAKEFPGASQTAWEWMSSKDLYKASFDFEGKKLNAYFNREGNLVATSRYIPKNMLPLIVLKHINESYPSHFVNLVIEYNHDDQLLYYVTLQGTKCSFIIEATPGGNLSVYEKIKHRK